jgi:hypothetical protein
LPAARASSAPSRQAASARSVNDIEHDPRRATAHTTIRGLILAPLKVGERVTGVICLGSTLSMAYTAAELKLLNTLALQTATAIENARLFERTIQAAQERERLMALHQATEVARARLQNELDLAARIQTDLFPASLPSLAGYDIAARNRPARRCGGDYYDAVAMSAGSNGGTLLCVADVSGKGLLAVGHGQHAGDTARAARPHRCPARSRVACERAAVRVDGARKVCDRRPRRTGTCHGRHPFRRRRPRRQRHSPRHR